MLSLQGAQVQSLVWELRYDTEQSKKKKKIQGYSWEQRNRRNFIKAKTGNLSSWRAREGDVLGQRSSWEKEEARRHPVGLVEDKPLLLSLCVCRDHHGADHVHHHHGRERLHAPRVLHQGRGHLPLGQLRVRVPLGAGTAAFREGFCFHDVRGRNQPGPCPSRSPALGPEAIRHGLTPHLQSEDHSGLSPCLAGAEFQAPSLSVWFPSCSHSPGGLVGPG